MRAALSEAQAADAAGEVPVGAVVVCNGVVVGRGHNACVHTHDPSAHAEMLALRAAAQTLGNYRLDHCELFVTLEPCIMCAGAMMHARLKRVVFGAFDPKTGAAGSVLNLFALPQLNHHTQVIGGLLAGDCAVLLLQFFARQREHQQQQKNQPGRALREDALRTPARHFELLPGMPTPSCYLSDLPSLAGLKLHYIDTGPVDAPFTQLYLHGPQDWSYCWRSQVAQATHAGQRVVCPDLIGFGMSDKPKKAAFHTLAWHVRMLEEFIDHLALNDLELRVPENQQELGKHLLAKMPQRFSRFTVVQADSMSLAAQRAPFPDAGHEAALRAFAKLSNLSSEPRP